MPMYEYICDDCGVFSAMNSMAVAHESKDCPACGTESQRIMSAPRLAVLSKSDRIAHERNEKSANAPMMGKSSSRCGCGGAHSSADHAKHSKSRSHDDEVKQKPKEKTGLQMQTKKTARPWMLAH